MKILPCLPVKYLRIRPGSCLREYGMDLSAMISQDPKQATKRMDSIQSAAVIPHV